MPLYATICLPLYAIPSHPLLTCLILFQPVPSHPIPSQIIAFHPRPRIHAPSFILRDPSIHLHPPIQLQLEPGQIWNGSEDLPAPNDGSNVPCRLGVFIVTGTAAEAQTSLAEFLKLEGCSDSMIP